MGREVPLSPDTRVYVGDVMTLVGSLGLFLTLLFLFIRYIPMISISESRELIAQRKEGQL